MSRPRRNHAADLRGVARLALEATRGVSGIVRDMQPPLGINSLVHQSLRGVTYVVGGGIDAVLGPLAALLGESRSRPELEAVLAAVNGVLGDHLAATANPLAIPMRVRRDGQALDLTPRGLAGLPATGKIVVLVHGLCGSDLQWRRRGHEHGEALEKDLGFTAIHLHYNSGQHISTNGRAFAEVLEQLVASWPVPVEDLALLCHSMGGLVARSACHEGARTGHRWLRSLHKVVFLGTPHHGAQAERLGNWATVALGAAPFAGALARVPKLRSAGITDLRHGSILEEDWSGRDRFLSARAPPRPVPLPRGVKGYAIAATLSAATTARLRGDGLVSVESALGLPLPRSRQWIAAKTGHLDLLDRREVYEQLRHWLSGPS